MRESKVIKETKICVQCGRPMEWRKRWEKNWDQVKYCSDACRSNAKKAKASAGDRLK